MISLAILYKNVAVVKLPLLRRSFSNVFTCWIQSQSSEKLVAYRRKEVAEKGNGNVYLMRTQLKEMKSQIKSLRKKVSNIRTGGRDKENECKNQRNSSINVMENALVGKSFVVEDNTVVMMVSLTLITFTMFCVRSMYTCIIITCI